MRVLILEPSARWARESLFNLPIGLRACFTAIDAGADALVLACDSDRVPRWFRDGRITVPLGADERPHGEWWVLRADALVSPALLLEIPLATALRDARGAPVAGHFLLASEQPAAVLNTAGSVAYVPDRYRYAVLVHDESSASAARRMLLDSLVKGTDGPVSRHLNRHVSRALTRLLLFLSVTPNQATMLVGVIGAAGAFFAAGPTYAGQALGAVLYQSHSIVDGCDGELARLTRRFTKHGALVDSLVDDICNVLFFGALSVGVARATGATWPLWTAGVTVAAYAAVAWLQYRTVLEATGKGDKDLFWREASGSRLTVMGVLRALFRRDVFILIVMCLVLLGLASLVVAAFPLAAVATLIATARRAFQDPAEAGRPLTASR